MKEILSLKKEAGWDYAMENFKECFGVLNGERDEVKNEDDEGHKLDRKMLELMIEY